MNSEPTLTYVYAVAVPTPELGQVLAGLHGVAEAPVALLEPSPGAGPAAPAFVTSHVPDTHWREEALKSHFEDLAWLEATARAHHHVIQVLTDHTTVLPLRMATLYQDNDRALAALHEQSRTFADRLALLAGHTEYGVKAYIPPDSPGPDTAPATPAPTSPGKAYLRARKAQHHAREDRYTQARQAAERIAATAARHATHVVRHPTQTGSLTRGEAGENVLNDAYLVPDGRADAFRTAIEEAVESFPGVRVEITGPWAPYSFAMPPPQPPRTTAQGPGART
ncbi:MULTISPECIES: GvpL/GvpF family gas vesicle protein [unclassified Streptomyces]|uniref:GvpL/GvpF family gas vesicle protein n=1 Tax=unclassified Streptomyces TaxID=2593676 RepID=UPI001BEAA714|nr:MULTISPECIES: GvpL/GvpF family gas vesicle protein [unclassified Streptomyces]MBT2405253.1 GvpL/GvpF family gas vesicle protein [Streptomyces sp. ISL-21]MBT2611021.1 GvpL/GvpF family gas vesicle protein [Streptomyces sp. ISL-87]